MVNKVFLQGRLTADPEIRTTQSGTKVANFSIAVERPFKDKSGNRKTDFLKCEAWRSSADLLAKYFKKGSMILVVGAMYQDSYTDNNGNRREKTWCNVEEVNFCESKKYDGDNAQTSYSAPQNRTPESYGTGGAPYPPSAGYGGDGAPYPGPTGQFEDLEDDGTPLPF